MDSLKLVDEDIKIEDYKGNIMQSATSHKTFFHQEVQTQAFYDVKKIASENINNQK